LSLLSEPALRDRAETERRLIARLSAEQRFSIAAGLGG